MKTIVLSIYVTSLIGAALLISYHRSASPSPPPAVSADTGGAVQSDSDPSNKTPIRLPLTRPKIVVLKSKRQLILYAEDKIVRTYRIGLGFNPTDDKIRQGDGATPEGTFYIFTKNAQSAFYLSLGISYPNIEDAERGLRDGLITRAQYKQIVRAIRRSATPPQNTPLGGQIYIHGNGSGSDWTWGCVALEDEEIKELFNAVPRGTTVVIEH